MLSKNLLAAVLVIGIESGCGEPAVTPAPTAASLATTNVTHQAGPDTTAPAAFAKLPGKWLRPDGGYILEIHSVASDGKLAAAYLNPRPINVAKAEASQAGGSIKVFIELRDVNYPGSTYTLIYDPAKDQFTGEYFQAAFNQKFDVVFTRVPR